MITYTDTELLDRAIVFAVNAHKGVERRGKGFPYVVHPLEALAIVATLTNDQELLAAAVLHDVVEDTDYTAADIEKEFGARVAKLVVAESDEEITGCTPEEAWRRRKEIALERLKKADRDTKIVAMGDKLSNMRAMALDYETMGDKLWEKFRIKDPKAHSARYHALCDAFSDLKDTVAYREFVFLVNRVFPL